jgi:tRNA (cmo5U34)-methyltransferase
MSEAQTSVGHRPEGKWAFDKNVTDVFTDMLRRSIPDYHTMRRLVFDLGSAFVSNNTDVLDIGCSRGDGLLPFIDRFGAHNRYVALDESGPMVAACRERFKGWINNGLLDVRRHDLRNGLPPNMPSLILSVLTLQFVPIEFRQRIVADAYSILRPGGAMVIVEKVLGPDAAADRLFVDAYYTIKRENGYSADDIEAKRLSLQGVLVPLTADANAAMLRAEGFRVQQFWQALNFAGWLAIKPKGATA